MQNNTSQSLQLHKKLQKENHRTVLYLVDFLHVKQQQQQKVQKTFK